MTDTPPIVRPDRLREHRIADLHDAFSDPAVSICSISGARASLPGTGVGLR
jgi:hypothetical protein